MSNNSAFHKIKYSRKASFLNRRCEVAAHEERTSKSRVKPEVGTCASALADGDISILRIKWQRKVCGRDRPKARSEKVPTLNWKKRLFPINNRYQKIFRIDHCIAIKLKNLDRHHTARTQIETPEDIGQLRANIQPSPRSKCWRQLPVSLSWFVCIHWQR